MSSKRKLTGDPEPSVKKRKSCKSPTAKRKANRHEKAEPPEKLVSSSSSSSNSNSDLADGYFQNNLIIDESDSSLSDHDCLVIDESEKNSRDCVYADSDNDVSEDCRTTEDNNACFEMWNNSEVLSEISGLRLDIAKNVVQLINDENTLPFIARYRKSMIDNMSPEKLQEIFDSYEYVCKIKKKALLILNTLKKNNKLTKELEKSIIDARSIDELDLVYEPFKVRTKTLAERAYSLGLGDSIQNILKGRPICIQSLCNSAMPTPEDVQTHLIHGLADVIHRDASVLKHIRKLKSEMNVIIECNKARTYKKKDPEKANKTSQKSSKHNNKNGERDNKENVTEKYDLYIGFRMRSDSIKPHQTLAINRGESEKVLSVKTIISDHFYSEYLKFCTSKWTSELISEAAADAYKRFFYPWLIRKIRSEMTDKAIKVSVTVFCANLKRLLLTSPIKGHNIVGVDPGFAAGCKIGIIGCAGEPLETFVIRPNFQKAPQYQNDPEAKKLCYFIEKYNCGVIALGNGTACRETECWLKNINEIKNIPLIIVPEQGASIYSCSPEAAKEFPKMDPNLISAISLARRALDPLSELIKVNPKHIGVGMYQHDVPQKLLNEALNNIIINCTSFVGVDINTASHTLLLKIAGLTETKVKNILQHRNKHGAFKCRSDLLEINGIGPKTYKQCIGFLRVPDSKNKLDNTWIHPESYDLAKAVLKEFSLQVCDIGTDNFIQSVRRKMAIMNTEALANKLKSAQCDIDLIISAFSQSPSEDPLRNVNPVYSMTINNKDQLAEGATLTGIVRNVTSFGFFVDCGVGQNGLIHVTKVGNSRHPQLGEKVLVKVIPTLTANKIPLQLIKILE